MNVEILSVKSQLTDNDTRVKHLEVELNNEKKLTESLIASKRELMDSLNLYMIRYETTEKDLQVMKEVSDHFEIEKEREFHDLNSIIRQLN